MRLQQKPRGGAQAPGIFWPITTSGASHGPEHDHINIEDARKALTKHSRRIPPTYGITVNPRAEEEAQVQTQEGTGTGRQTEHTNINYKRGLEKLEEERERIEWINARV